MRDVNRGREHEEDDQSRQLRGVLLEIPVECGSRLRTRHAERIQHGEAREAQKEAHFLLPHYLMCK